MREFLKFFFWFAYYLGCQYRFSFIIFHNCFYDFLLLFHNYTYVLQFQ